jgi:HemY protein
MIRVALYLVLVGLIALGAAWLADRPGDVVVTWLGYRIETSLMVTACAVALIAALAILFWSLLRALLRSPDLIALILRNRRGVRGYQAISRGLIAVGAGDTRAARKFAEEANSIAPGEPLALLLSAQTAQLAGDRAAAERAFRAMASRDDTKLIGLHGLYIEAQRREDGVAARAYSEEAAKQAPALAWAGEAALSFRCAAGDWAGAIERLEANMKNRMLDKAAYRRQRAVLLTARAFAGEESDRDSAKAFALEAAKLDPTLVPAAALAGRLLAESGEQRKATRIVEKAWRANPHPDLAETYAQLRLGDSARDRLARIEALAQKTPGHTESLLAVARAALDAQEFAKARAALAPLLAAPTQRVALLMAEIEEKQHGDEGRAREWMARALHAARDPAWTADGFVSDRWMPVSPVTGRLDAFQWKVPVADLEARPALIEQPEATADVAALEAASPAVAAEIAADQGRSQMPVSVEAPASAIDIAKPVVGQEARAPRRVPAPPLVETVIPLVHAPDDPGPEPEAEPEEPVRPPLEGWRRLRLFFR